MLLHTKSIGSKMRKEKFWIKGSFNIQSTTSFNIVIIGINARHRVLNTDINNLVLLPYRHGCYFYYNQIIGQWSNIFRSYNTSSSILDALGVDSTVIGK